jgi:hypothetical protein
MKVRELHSDLLYSSIDGERRDDMADNKYGIKDVHPL